jgi:hypothetical protein
MTHKSGAETACALIQIKGWARLRHIRGQH